MIKTKKKSWGTHLESNWGILNAKKKHFKNATSDIYLHPLKDVTITYIVFKLLLLKTKSKA